MRIGIDARFLTHPQLGGFKTYTRSLIDALSQVDEENQYILYLDRTPTDEKLPQGRNFSWRVVNGILPGVGMPLREQITLRRQAVADKVDLIHFLCNTATVHLPLPYVVTLHDTIQVTQKNPFPLSKHGGDYKRWAITAYSRWAILQTAHGAKRIMTVSNHEKAQIARHLQIEPERIVVTHLAPNLLFKPAGQEEKMAWRNTLSLRYGLPCRFVLGIGYEPRKNIPLLIQTFAQIATTHPELGLVIVAAEANQRALFQVMINERRLAERAIVLGALPAQELAKLYNIAEAFVFPSERESFGLPPLEAMACGVPTVAMNQSSIPEIVQNGALLIDGKEPAQWAAALHRVIMDQNLRATLIYGSLQRTKQLSWQKCAQITIDTYREIVAENPIVKKSIP